MKVHFFEEDKTFPKFFRRKKARSLIQNIIELESSKSINYINIILCSDSYLLHINTSYLQHSYYTDIITFDYSNNVIESDIFISLDRIVENAEKNCVTLQSELHRIIIHGILHLVGYKDATKEEKKLMTQKENYYLNLI